MSISVSGSVSSSTAALTLASWDGLLDVRTEMTAAKAAAVAITARAMRLVSAGDIYSPNNF